MQPKLQISADRGISNFFYLPPLSSCLFLPVKTKFGDSVDAYSCCFWGWHLFPSVFLYFSSLHESITPARWRRLQVFVWSMFLTLQIWNLLRRGLVVCGWIFPHWFSFFFPAGRNLWHLLAEEGCRFSFDLYFASYKYRACHDEYIVAR